MSGFFSDGAACMRRAVGAGAGIRQDVPPLQVYEVDDTCRWIRHNNYTKVCLQFPDTLLGVSTDIYKAIQSEVEADVFILGDTTYSSCCVDEIAAAHVKADAVVHYGHACFSSSSMPVYTVLPKQDIDVESSMNSLRNQFRDDSDVKLCLFYDAAYHHLTDDITEHWFKMYPNSCIAYVDLKATEHRVMGRCITNADSGSLKLEDIEKYVCIYLGSRSQTLFNCIVSIKAQQWHCLDPNTNGLSELDESPWFKRRRYLVERCKDAKNIGILVCKLSGQSTKDIITRMKEICKMNQKKSYIVSVGKPNVAKLANFPEIDLYVMIACPENDLYSSREFYKPLVYPYELEVALNANRPLLHNSHITDFEDLLPNRRGFCPVSEIEENTDVSLITGKIRETKIFQSNDNVTDIEKVNWAVESIGQHLQQRAWTGLAQNLGGTQVKTVEEGRSGLPISYRNEPS